MENNDGKGGLAARTMYTHSTTSSKYNYIKSQHIKFCTRSNWIVRSLSFAKEYNCLPDFCNNNKKTQPFETKLKACSFS